MWVFPSFSLTSLSQRRISRLIEGNFEFIWPKTFRQAYKDYETALQMKFRGIQISSSSWYLLKSVSNNTFSHLIIDGLDGGELHQTV